MIYPNELVHVNNNLSIYIPDDNQVQLIYANMMLEQRATPFPFWAKIWPAAKAMTSFLEKEPKWIKNKKVLEIGAGIALPSLTIAKDTASIIISDYSPDAVELIQKNISYLKINNANAICLDWNHIPENLFADTILLSDINYDPSQFKALNQLIERFLKQDSTLIIATPQRITATPFVQLLQPYIKKIFTETVHHENHMIDIGILILQR